MPSLIFLISCLGKRESACVCFKHLAFVFFLWWLLLLSALYYDRVFTGSGSQKWEVRVFIDQTITVELNDVILVDRLPSNSTGNCLYTHDASIHIVQSYSAKRRS